MVTIKDLFELSRQYGRDNLRGVYSDIYTYGTFLDLLDDYRANETGDTQDGDYTLINNHLTIEEVWGEYLESDKAVSLEYGFESAYDYILDYFCATYTTEIGEKL
jgi:hypothetical protein